MQAMWPMGLLVFFNGNNAMDVIFTHDFAEFWLNYTYQNPPHPPVKKGKG